MVCVYQFTSTVLIKAEVVMNYNTIISFILVAIHYGSADYCEDDFSMSDFPKGILANIISQATYSLIPTPDCSHIQVDKNAINLWYWTRQNPEIPVLLNKNNPSQFDVNKHTIVLVPGWLCNVTNDRMPELRNAYLERYDCNVIGVDWSKYSIDLYGNSYCAIPQAAKIVANFICTAKLDVGNIHIVGHSMGGQMAGLIGKSVQALCSKKIWRITGLDPAGPVYQFKSETNRLAPTDAESVDVIHTNGGMFGYFGTCGTTDFFPNCGVVQPGCMDLTSLSPSSLINLPLRYVNCNHVRSLEYMIESIGSDTFVGKSSITAPISCINDVFYSTAVMGEGCMPVNKNDKYVLKTNSKPPYAKRSGKI